METKTPIYLRTSVSPVSPSCSDEAGAVCGPCGKCGNGETETACVGDDGTLYGSDASDCPAGQVSPVKRPFLLDSGPRRILLFDRIPGLSGLLPGRLDPRGFLAALAGLLRAGGTRGEGVGSSVWTARECATEPR